MHLTIDNLTFINKLRTKIKILPNIIFNS